jgi:hypothetical protein
MRRRFFSHSECVGAFGATPIVLLVIWAGTVANAATPGSLEEAYQTANGLATTPGGIDEAMAGYQAIVETHLANETVFDSALRQLARQYMDSGRVDEGIQFFLNLGQKMYGQQRPYTLREILSQFKLKYPEQTEKAIAQLQSSSDRQIGGVPAMPAKELSKAILQRDDAQLREKGLEKLQTMLAPQSSDDEKKQGLATLGSVLTAKFDRRSFRDLVLPLLASPTPEIRAAALGCLPGLEATTQDLDLVLPMAPDESPKVRREVGPVLIQVGKGQEKDRIIPVLMQLLQDKEPEIVEWTLRSMWGQYASPEFDELLIRLSRDPKLHGNVIYFGLSTMKSKSPAVCRRLIEELADPDWNNSGRAAWGLTYGVPEEAKSMVEDGLLKALPQETNEYTRKEEFRALRMVATEKSRGYLKSVVDSPQETDNDKQLAREILAELSSAP